MRLLINVPLGTTTIPARHLHFDQTLQTGIDIDLDVCDWRSQASREQSSDIWESAYTWYILYSILSSSRSFRDTEYRDLILSCRVSWLDAQIRCTSLSNKVVSQLGNLNVRTNTYMLTMYRHMYFGHVKINVDIGHDQIREQEQHSRRMRSARLITSIFTHTPLPCMPLATHAPPPCMPPAMHPPPRVGRMSGVKTLPDPKLRLRAVKSRVMYI